MAKGYNILEVTERLFVTGDHQFVVVKGYNILEVTKKLFVAEDHQFASKLFF